MISVEKARELSGARALTHEEIEDLVDRKISEAARLTFCKCRILFSNPIEALTAVEIASKAGFTAKVESFPYTNETHIVTISW